jgi:hypothetical protein
VTDQGKSIVEEIRGGQYEASVIATFNTYFPFYEEVILPHLQNSGCRQNAILMDARMCGGTLNVESLRPRSAGKQYSLIPISCIGSFHPKILLLIGKNKGLLLVGSHNLTLAGFSHNRELTNRFEFVVDGDMGSLPAFRSAWNFVQSWSKKAPSLFQKTIEQIGMSAPWLMHDTAAAQSNPVLTVLPDGPPLWDQLLEHLPRKAYRTTVVGPFFDSDFAFLARLSSQYPKAELIVGIDPGTVVLRESARKAVRQAQFVLTDCLRKGKGYLHAKALLVESEDGSEVLVSGSANPSRPAWFEPANDKGNAEVVVVSKVQAKQSLSKALGFRKLLKSPLVSDEVWKLIAARKLPSDFQSSGGAAATAFETDLGIEVFTSSPKTKVKPQAQLIAADGSLLATVVGALGTTGELQLTIGDRALLSKVVLLELETEKGARLNAVVHHPMELAALAQSDKERSLRTALDSLETDKPLIEDLMKIVEKVIFDNDFSVTTPTGKSETTEKTRTKAEKVQDIFSISLSETHTQKNATQRLLASGDLGALLDALIHQLGIGLEASIRQRSGIGLSEEELVDTEDEELVRIVEVDSPKLVSLCQKKIKRMVRRMIGQLENAATSDSLAARALVQLAAVLGIVHRLCSVTSDEAKWLPRNETLVPIEARHELFLEATRLLYSTSGVMRRALDRLQNRPFEEVSFVRGLLLWLAWDCDYHVEDPLAFEDPDDIDENIWGLSRMLAIALDLQNDEPALEKAQNAIESSAHEYNPSDYDPEWLRKFIIWASEMQQLASNENRSTTTLKEAASGDIVFADKPRRLFVVAEAFHGKVKLIDLDSEDELRPFSSKYVSIAKSAK